ncbi:MAG: hypothetical protein D6679_03705 [Candidatus Hydrogenedentota bacterium]|nr:MAG: hypothetical protein D6679_03705 [Candidatus Hydrogenedentota bacterium]
MVKLTSPGTRRLPSRRKRFSAASRRSRPTKSRYEEKRDAESRDLPGFFGAPPTFLPDSTRSGFSARESRHVEEPAGRETGFEAEVLGEPAEDRAILIWGATSGRFEEAAVDAFSGRGSRIGEGAGGGEKVRGDGVRVGFTGSTGRSRITRGWLGIGAAAGNSGTDEIDFQSREEGRGEGFSSMRGGVAGDGAFSFSGGNGFLEPERILFRETYLRGEAGCRLWFTGEVLFGREFGSR